MFNTQSLTVENCIIKLILIKLRDGRTQNPWWTYMCD